MKTIAQMLKEKQTIRELIQTTEENVKNDRGTIRDLKEQYERLDEDLDQLVGDIKSEARN